jgi:hypothetical protein
VLVVVTVVLRANPQPGRELPGIEERDAGGLN